MSQPQLTPEQQIVADLQQKEPDKYYAVKFNGALSQYGDLENRRRTAQAQLDQVSQNMAPNSPFLLNLKKQAASEAEQQGKTSGMPWTRDAYLKQVQQNYQNLLEPTTQQNSAIWRANSARINDYENKLAEISEDKRPLISDEEVGELQGYKDGINKIDMMTGLYQQVLQKHPELGGLPQGQFMSKLESYANDPVVRAYTKILPLAQSFYAKRVGSESGKLSNQGMELAYGAMPSPGDSAATATQKATDLKSLIASDYNSKLAGLQQGMRRTGDFQPIDLGNPSTYAPTPAQGGLYSNPSNQFSPGTNPPPDPVQNPNVTPQASSTPAASPMPDYAQRSLNYIDNFLMGNSAVKQKVAQQATQQAQAQAAQSQQAAAQQTQQTAAQAQQAGAQAAVQELQSNPTPGGT